MSVKRGLSEWSPPTNEEIPVLKLYNSLTRRKDEFIPQVGKRVTWYICGPTVYDSSHMGHARNYISFDIIRRVLSDYFKYDLTLCMNITDIDDKIIKRARQCRLFEDYSKKDITSDELLKDVTEAVNATRVKFTNETDEDKKSMLSRLLAKADSALDSFKAINCRSLDELKLIKNNLLQDVKDLLSDWLDKKYGSSITDNSIFFDLPKHYEDEFFTDMKLLNILPPDILTRVTEYVPEIIDFVQQIIDNGFAYESGGSVYFDTIKFSHAENNFYAKLVPEAFGDVKALQDGEGDLILTADRLSEKKNPADFALWKLSKPGEPTWDSPWGKGRPGWHIECSAMAGKIFGKTMDIHTGGYDLKFPHHDNEIAQSEAYFKCSNWVNYFLHSGHLTINGQKMSKSLKNFTTIKEALEKYTSTQIRYAFLLHSWKDTLDYSPETLSIALAYEKTFNEFFLNVKSILRQLVNQGKDRFHKYTDLDMGLYSQFTLLKASVHECLCDSIDTRGAMERLKEIITDTNIYIKETSATKQSPNHQLLKSIATYLTDMLKVFGAIEQESTIGFTNSSEMNVNTEEVVLPFLDCIADFRKAVRKNATQKKDVEALNLCDAIRDDILPFLGVRMEDVEGDMTAIKLVAKEILIKEREEKIKAKERDRLAKELKKAKAEEEKKAKDLQRSIPPEKLFTTQTDKYSKFDDKGLPTHAADGSEITKSQMKKLQKLWEAQAKKYEDYVKGPSVNGAPMNGSAVNGVSGDD